MADTTNHVSVTQIGTNTDLDPDKANETLDNWESKTTKVKGSNVRDEALDSFALGKLRAVYVSKLLEDSSSDGDTTIYWRGLTGHREGADNQLAPIHPPDQSTRWVQVNMAYPGLFPSGLAPTSISFSGFSRPARLTFPLYAVNDYRGDAYNHYNRWVLYCSCEMMIQRPRGGSGSTYCPQVELALGYSVASQDGPWTTMVATRRGFGIGNPPNGVCSPEETIPTSLSYSVVHGFAPELAVGEPTTLATATNTPVWVTLMGRYVDGRDWHEKGNRFWWSAMNVNLFAVNYRR